MSSTRSSISSEMWAEASILARLAWRSSSTAAALVRLASASEYLPMAACARPIAKWDSAMDLESLGRVACLVFRQAAKSSMARACWPPSRLTSPSHMAASSRRASTSTSFSPSHTLAFLAKIALASSSISQASCRLVVSSASMETEAAPEASEEAEETTNLQLAWEMLELAKAIFAKKAKVCEGEEAEETTNLQLAWEML